MEANDRMNGLIRGKSAGAGPLLCVLLVVWCETGNSENTDVYGPNPYPNGVAGVKLEFARHELTGLSGSPVVAFETPPYVIGTANDGSGQLTVLNQDYYGLGSVYASKRVAY